MKWRFRRAVREVHRRQEDRIIGKASGLDKTPRERTVGKEDRKTPVLSGYKDLPKSLRGKYKGKTFRAYVRKDGSIFFRGKRYPSPSKAGNVALGRGGCNGWRFWYYERSPGDWVRLDTLRR